MCLIKDTPQQIFRVHYNDPYEIIQSLRVLLSNQGSSNPSSSASTGSEQQQITLIPEPDKNYIIVKAPAQEMMLIQSWIQKLDSKDSYLLDEYQLASSIFIINTRILYTYLTCGNKNCGVKITK